MIKTTLEQLFKHPIHKWIIKLYLLIVKTIHILSEDTNWYYTDGRLLQKAIKS